MYTELTKINAVSAMNTEELAMVTGGIGYNTNDIGSRTVLSEIIKKQREKAEARLRKEEEECWRIEQARLNAETSVDLDDGLMPAVIFK